jgi:hypothetical protein
VYLFELPLAAALVLLILRYGTAPFRSLRFRPVGDPVALFLGYLVISLAISLPMYSLAANLVAAGYLFRLAVHILTGVYLAFALKHGDLSRTGMTRAIVYTGIVLLIGAGVQYLYYPDLRNLYYAGWDPHYFRVFGLFFEPVVAAAVYGIFLVYFATYSGKTRFDPVLRWGATMIPLLLVIATFSRGAYVALAALGFRAVASGKRLLPAIAVCLLGITVLMIIPKPSGEGVNLLRTSTIQSRLADYREGVLVWSQRPVLGIGYNHIREEKRDYREIDGSGIPNNAAGAFHSTFLTILATSGIIGLLLYANMLWGLSRTSTFAAGALLFLGVLAVFDNVLTHPLVLFPFSLMLGERFHEPHPNEEASAADIPEELGTITPPSRI